MAKKKSTIGANPLDGLLESKGGEQPQRDKRERLEAAGKSSSGSGKLRLTVHVPSDLIERAKNAVFWTPGLTLAALAEQALERELKLIEQGKPFPPRTSELRGGRPVK